MAAPAGRGDGDDSLQYWYWPHRRQITSTNLVPAQQYDTTSPSHYTSHWHTARVEIQSCSGRGQVVESQYWPRPAVDQPIVSKDGHKGRHLLAEKCNIVVWNAPCLSSAVTSGEQHKVSVWCRQLAACYCFPVSRVLQQHDNFANTETRPPVCKYADYNLVS